jgi:hypothetical protein
VLLANIIRMIKLRGMRWAGNVTRVAGNKRTYNLVGKPEGKNGYKDLAVDGQIILNGS